MKEWIEKAVEYWKNLTSTKKMLIGGGTASLLLAVILLLSIGGGSSYKMLYSNLDTKTAGKIVEELSKEGVEYKLSNGGTTILVPADVVYRERLKIASKDILATGVGYEIFDKTNLGITEFVQKVNYQRALEGELARTIESLNEVRHARVHLSIPEEKLFAEDQTKPKASVMLSLERGVNLNRKSIEGIVNLVAGSVDGLIPKNVIIVDGNGNFLNKEPDKDERSWELTNKQLQLKKDIENYLIKKAQSMLIPVFGAGNVVIKVDADLDFSKVDRMVEKYDPKGQVARSEQSNTKECTNSDGSTENSENTITNYEIGKTVEHFVNETRGAIKKLTVSAFVNGTYAKDKKGKIVYNPLDGAELEKVKKVIMNAVGYDSKRGDTISVENIAFRTMKNEAAGMVPSISLQGFLFEHIKDIFVVLMILSLMIIIFLTTKKLIAFFTAKAGIKEMKPTFLSEQEQLAAAEEVAEEEKQSRKERLRDVLSEPLEEKELTEEEIAFLRKMEYIKQYTTENPADAANIIKAWITEG